MRRRWQTRTPPASQRRVFLAFAGAALGSDVAVHTWDRSDRGTIVGFVRAKSSEYVLKTHARDDARPAVVQNYEGLVALEELSSPKNIAVPAAVSIERTGQRVMTLEARIPGQHVKPSLVSEYVACQALWSEMLEAWSAPASKGEDLLQSRVSDHLSRLRALQVLLPEDAVRWALHALIRSGWPRVVGVEHGDFHFGNIIWREGAPAGVVDWADLRLQGFPDLDFVHLFLSWRRAHEGTGHLASWLQLLASPPQTLVTMFGDAAVVKAIAIVYWLHFLDRNFSNADERWRRVHVNGTLDALRSLRSSAS